MLTHPEQLTNLPGELISGELAPVLVTSGDDLEGLIGGDDQIYRRCRRKLEAAAGS